VVTWHLPRLRLTANGTLYGKALAGSIPALTTAQFILVILDSADTKTKTKITNQSVTWCNLRVGSIP